MINTRTVLFGLVAILSTAATGCAQEAGSPEPALRLVAGSPSVTLDRYDKRGVLLDLDIHVVADAAPFEVRVTRKSYGDPIVATQLVSGQSKPFPAHLVHDFTGLPGFLQVTLTSAAGETVLTRDQTFCPNAQATRRRPSAPSTSPYPSKCSTNPFTFGGVWGIQAGWSASANDAGFKSVELPVGSYTARVQIADAYRDFLKIPPDRASATVALTVRAASPPGAREAEVPAELSTLQPNEARPTGPAIVPEAPRPDLRPLPAGGMTITRGTPGTPTASRDFLAFFATVWNAGPAPLVIDGFRRPGEDVMDAYQYFYDHGGNQIGHAPSGVLQWDTRDGHRHWHLVDFAGYRLLDSAHREVVRSEKTGFCLASTDAIDLTVAYANWRPLNTDLRIGCGGYSIMSLREVLDVGSGDTYRQELPGQSFDITDLPNGTYYVEVSANPAHRLHEADMTNNVSLRQVNLDGTPGVRTVTVPPYELVDAS